MKRYHAQVLRTQAPDPSDRINEFSRASFAGALSEAFKHNTYLRGGPPVHGGDGTLVLRLTGREVHALWTANGSRPDAPPGCLFGEKRMPTGWCSECDKLTAAEVAKVEAKHEAARKQHALERRRALDANRKRIKRAQAGVATRKKRRAKK